MKAIVKYETEDGKVFDSMEEAQAYEDRLLNGHWYDVEFAVHGTTMLEVCAYSKEEAIELAKKMFDPYDDECCADLELGDLIKVYE